MVTFLNVCISFFLAFRALLVLPSTCTVFLPVVLSVFPVRCIDFLPVVLFVLLVICTTTHFASGSKSITFIGLLAKLRERFALFASIAILHFDDNCGYKYSSLISG